jgi:HK97 family phage major capsid protein
MKVSELKNKRAKSLEAADAIKSANGDDLTQKHMDQISGYLDEADKLSVEIKQAEENEKTLLRLEKNKPAPTGPKSVETGQITHVKDNIADDPKKGFKSHKDFFMEVMSIGQSGSLEHASEGMKFLNAVGSDEQSVIDDPYGGFLVPEAFVNQPMSVSAEADPTLGRTMSIPMASPTVKIPARVDKDHSTSVSGGLSVSRTAETNDPASSRIQYEQVKLEATKLMGLSYVTEELLQDSPISVAALLSAGFNDEFASELLDEKLNGTGVGQYTGVMNSACLVTVAAEGGQSADTIQKENIFKMRSRCWGYSNAVWIANHDTIPQLADLNDSNNNIYQPSLREDIPELLMGRPIFYSEYAQTLGDLGDLVLGNWSQYIEGSLSPLQSAESVHVRFVNHERTFKFWMRNDGAPWWKSALTPKNSANTLSPFVTLAAR